MTFLIKLNFKFFFTHTYIYEDILIFSIPEIISNEAAVTCGVEEMYSAFLVFQGIGM